MEKIPGPQSRFIQQMIRLAGSRPRTILVLLALAALGPFIAKAFNVDDPLFLWAAKHIQSEPANPYNFSVNWYGFQAPMWQVTKNPPLASYYLALSASVLGWSEIALHCAFLVPAVMAILGTYRLAKNFCERPFFVAVTTLFMPVFLVSSTSVMCDTMMLAFWVWSVALWVEGMEKQDFARLFVSAVLMTLAAFTKYFGICLIPLLAAYSLIKTRKIGAWAICFVIPMAALITYQWITFRLYGRGLLTDAGSYATQKNPFHLFQIPSNTLIALSFTGGCAAVATFLTPWLWRGRTFQMMILGTVVFALAVFAGSFWAGYRDFKAMSHTRVGFELVFWAIGGVSLLGLAVADAWQRRDATSSLLALWVFGTFIFAGFINWTVNGRSILPMAPAVAILLARRLSPLLLADEVKFDGVVIRSAMAAGLGLLVATADYGFAQANRIGAQQTFAKYGHGPHKLWFTGHWGWQYYMEQLGVSALTTDDIPADGDLLAAPVNNTNAEAGKRKVTLLEFFGVNGRQLASTLNSTAGAGFYSSLLGPLPFGFGRVAPETIVILAFGSAADSAPQKQK